jgi:SAM-dependent methyltransferase
MEAADEFGMRRKPGNVSNDGNKIPFPDGSFDHVLCVEVLEHMPDPATFLKELVRVLRKDCTLIMTVMWSACLHHLPHDYGRFTRFGLERTVTHAGFTNIRNDERGHDIDVLANKLLVFTVRLLQPAHKASAMWSWPLAMFVGPVAAAFILASHLAFALELSSRADPLGYALVASHQ